MSSAPQQSHLQIDISNKQILSIALPIAAAMLVPQLNFITNNIFLAGLGEVELGLAGITGVYYLIFAVIGMGLNNGLQALISRRAGENRIGEIGALFNNGLAIALAMALIGIAATYLLAPPILRFSMHNQEHVQVALDFLYIRIWGLPFLYIYQMRNALLVGTNNSRYLIIGTFAEAIANVFFDYGLIYGKLGMPNMGFNGAAVASIIAEATGLFVIFLVMRFKGITKRLELFKQFTLDRSHSSLILNLSTPLILQHAISIISWEFFYILIEHHGTQALAVSNTMRNIFGAFGCIVWAFAATTNTMVSNVIGQGLEHRVHELLSKIIKLCFGITFCIVLVLNIAPAEILSIYGQSEAFIEAAVPVVRIVSVALLMMSVAVIYFNAVIGTGNSKINLIVEIAAIICYCLYVYLTLEHFDLHITIGWMSEWLYWSVLFLPSFLYMRSNRWKLRRI